jgi:hypothetical protein
MFRMIDCPSTLSAENPSQEQLWRFEMIIRSDPDLMQLLESIRRLRLPQWRLVAGCRFGTFSLPAIVARASRTMI